MDKTIWTGDNLDILRGLNSETFNLIYLDPPFNSNQDYAAPVGSTAAGAAFKDTWKLSDLDVAWMGLIADEEPSIANAIKTAGLTAGKGMQSYLTMMAVRLLEMRRVLKPTGSIYLHCDPTASHYLKMLLDALFGRSNFRNEITWKRITALHASGQHNPKKWGSSTDTLLYYAKTKAALLQPYRGLDDDEVKKLFKSIDGNGERYYDDSSQVFRSPCMGDRPNLCYEWRGFTNPHPSGWRLSKERLEEEYQKGNIVIVSDERLVRRKYLKDYRGKPIGNLWDDILPASGKERTHYPTQKPLALLKRIIQASSNKGDWILDPFCGCATACVAAESLERKWVGIDLSAKAADLVNIRLKQTMGSLFHNRLVTTRTDVPRRTDIKIPKNYRENKHHLYGAQEGLCKGCKMDFPFKAMEVDHIIPRARGGPDHLENLQLLCSHCNRVKGDRSQEYLISQVAAV